MSDDGLCVLIVDSTPDYLLLWRLLLRQDPRIGAVHEASTGRDAMTCIDDNNDIDVVLTDLWTPDVTGYDLLAFARGRRPHLAVVLTSCAIGIEEEALRRGASGYVDKSLTVGPDLAAMLSVFVTQSRLSLVA